MKTIASGKFRFGNFELDTASRMLTRDGTPVDLNTRAFDLLCALVSNAGNLVTKAELLDLVWPDQFVEENNISVQISSLRKALNDDRKGSSFISTIAGRGYIFVADVSRVENGSIHSLTSNGHGQLTKEGWSPFKRVVLGLAIAGGLMVALTALIFSLNQSESSDKAFRLTQLTYSGRISNATITPDGEYCVFSRREAEGESLWLRHISTNSEKEVLPPTPTKFVGLSVTPDNNFIYATTFSKNIADPQLWKIPKLGGAIEVIPNIATGAAVSFSPDGSKMAFTESRSSLKQTQLLVADSNGENKKILVEGPDDVRSFPNFDANPVSWSNDGNRIAVAFSAQNASTRYGILLVDSEGNEIRTINDDRWDHIQNISWFDNDSLIISAMTIDPQRAQLWSVSGKTGEVTQITNDLHSYSWVASAQQRIIAVQKNPISRISLADFDLDADGLNFSEITKESGNIDTIAFSLDGRIVYSSGASGQREIWSMNADGTDPKQLTVNSGITFGLTVSPTDGSIVFCSTKDGESRLQRLTAESGSVISLTGGTEDVFPHFASDGRTIIFQKGLTNKVISLYRLNLENLEQSPVSAGFAARPTVSTKDDRAAYYFMDEDGMWRIKIISHKTGSGLRKIDLPPTEVPQKMRWYTGSDLIGQIVYEGDTANLLMIPIDSGTSKTFRSVGSGIVNSFAWSNDGKRLAVSHTDEQKNVILLAK